jgi:hypothetical protein
MINYTIIDSYKCPSPSTIVRVRNIACYSKKLKILTSENLRNLNTIMRNSMLLKKIKNSNKYLKNNIKQNFRASIASEILKSRIILCSSYNVSGH